MFKGISFDDGLDKFRERVRKMSDEELIHQGKACRNLRSDKSPDRVWTETVSLSIAILSPCERIFDPRIFT